MSGEDAEQSLINMLENGRDAAQRTVGEAISGLRLIATRLDMRETAARLGNIQRRLDSGTFNVMIMGRFKSGKSTLLNALLVGTTRPVAMSSDGRLLAVGPLPTTAVLTSVHYADQPSVKVQHMDGTAEMWTFDRYLRDSALTWNDEEGVRSFEGIMEFQVGFPAALCQAGVTVVDTPGMDESPLRIWLTRAAARQADVVIRPYRSDDLMGQNELEEDAEVRQAGTRVFTVVNVWGDTQVDDRMRAFVWNRYIRDYRGGPNWDRQDLADYDIYLVHAEQAFLARAAGDAAGVERSGLGALERRLGEYLTTYRLPAQLQRYATSAVQLAGTIDQHVNRRLTAARAGRGRLQEADTAERPRLRWIRARARSLPKLVKRYRTEAADELIASFILAVTRIREVLPEQIHSMSLPGVKNFPMKYTRLMAETFRDISAFVIGGLDHWTQYEVPAILGSVLERLGDEIQVEVEVISREFDEINLALTGPKENPTDERSAVNTAERVISAFIDVAFGDVRYAVTGGVGGWRGWRGGSGVISTLGTSILAGLSGRTGTVLSAAIPADSAVYGYLATGAGLEGRVRKMALMEADKALNAMSEEARSVIVEKVDAGFGELEMTVGREITALIDEEERNIENIAEMTIREETDNGRAELARYAAAVTEHRLALARALAIYRQA